MLHIKSGLHHEFAHEWIPIRIPPIFGERKRLFASSYLHYNAAKLVIFRYPAKLIPSDTPFYARGTLQSPLVMRPPGVS